MSERARFTFNLEAHECLIPDMTIDRELPQMTRLRGLEKGAQRDLADCGISYLIGR